MSREQMDAIDYALVLLDREEGSRKKLQGAMMGLRTCDLVGSGSIAQSGVSVETREMCRWIYGMLNERVCAIIQASR